MIQDRKPISPTNRFQRQPVRYWRWLLAPMLLASLGLHGLILLIPTAPSEDELMPPPDPEEDGIAITKIDAPQSRPPASTPPANTGTVKTAPAAPPAATPRPAQATTRPSSPARVTSSRSDRPNRDRQSSRNATATSDTNGRDTAKTQPTVPDLSTVEAVQNPNSSAPDIPSSNGGAIAATADFDGFEEYIQVFADYNGVQISEAEAIEFRQSWLDSFANAGTPIAEADIQSLDSFNQLPYNANICLPHAPETAQILVWIDAEGAVNEYKQFVQRTGYRNFDEAALKLIDDYDFPDTTSSQAYLAEISVDYDPEECDWPPQVSKLPADYFAVLNAYIGPTLTTPEEAKTAQAAWLQTLTENDILELPNPGALNATPLDSFDKTVAYPLAICLPIEPQDAQWGVLVSAEGSLQGEPQPLRSTGYQNFDNRAKELVQTFNFPATETPQIYVIEVPVDYNSVNCQSPDSEEFSVLATAAAAGDTSAEIASSQTNDSNPSEATLSDTHSASLENRPQAPSSTGTSDSGDLVPLDDLVAFDGEQQTQLLEQGRLNVLNDPMGNLNSLPDVASASIASGWPEGIDRSCFLSALDDEQGPVPVEAAADAIVLSDDVEFVPLTLSRLYGVEVADAGEYCNAPLLKMAVEGIPQLFSSTIGFGNGNAHSLIVIWPADPREPQ